MFHSLFPKCHSSTGHQYHLLPVVMEPGHLQGRETKTIVSLATVLLLLQPAEPTSIVNKGIISHNAKFIAMQLAIQ